MNQNTTITFIGGGHMATSLAAGLLSQPQPPHLILSDHNPEQRQRLAELFPAAQIAADNIAAVRQADVVIIAVKPQGIRQAAREIKPALQRHPLVLSIAAGITTSRLAGWLGSDTAIVRVMPNTPALVGCGAAGLFATSHVAAHQRELAESILRSTGLALWFNREEDLDAVTALSGSGPAYVFLLMEAMESAGIDLGLPREAARLLALQTVFGAAKLALESPEPVATLRQRVTSPGGTTAAALAIFESQDLRGMVRNAMHAAAERARELARERA